ncbi:MAG: hypothetical protein Fur003_1410 [Candidatus Dojkabacteria bacterium]
MTPDQWNLDNVEKNQAKAVKRIRVLLSVLLATAGGVILSFQLIPLANSWLKQKVIESKNQNIVSPVPGSIRRDIGGEFAYWDPSVSYFENLIGAADGIYQTDPSFTNPITPIGSNVVIDESYKKSMKLTIAALGINKINVQPNVESYSEDIYNKVLKNGLAHFKGTPVCGDGGNCFIYGHSAVQSYFNNHKNSPETIFTKLEDIQIGDNVEIERDGKVLKYIVRKKKIVEPTDFSILKGVGGKETVTLMTCTPIGIGTHRLIVIADRYE